jgi:hypothetical protein
MAAFTLTPENVSGTCDDGDIILRLLDEVLTVIDAAHTIEESGRGDDTILRLLCIARRKADAAQMIYDQGLHLPPEPAAQDSAPIDAHNHAAEE